MCMKKEKKVSNENGLKMPERYSVICNMEEIEGGKNYSYKYSYSTRIGAIIAANSIKKRNHWNNISTYDLAAEIWCHAYAYYQLGGFLAFASAVGMKSAANGFAASIMNGIDVENGVDRKKIKGIPRYKLFRAVYGAALAFI